jgi:NAD(P)H-nitrite reductase large subunit
MLNVSGINLALNIDGPDFIEEEFFDEELNIGNIGISGWNHTEEAKKAIGDKNRKYQTEEERLKALAESRRKMRNSSKYKERIAKWREDNKEEQKRKQFMRDEKCGEQKKEYAREYYRKNKDMILKRAAEKYAAKINK